MPDINLEKLHPAAREKISPFLQEILAQHNEKIHSIYITGTAITEDFVPGTSDVNSIFVLKQMELKFLESIAPLGKKYGRQKVSAPLIMTPEYIENSLDVFPIEFLNFSLIHSTASGQDILKDIEIRKTDLRRQCERELKTKLIGLRQGYISTLGDRKAITEGFVSSLSGYIPLFRGIISLLGKKPPVSQADAIALLGEVSGVDTQAFTRVLRGKREKTKLSLDELHTIFEHYYSTIEKLGKIVDEIKE